MHCPRCRAANADRATFCAMCGARLADEAPAAPPTRIAADEANPYRAPEVAAVAGRDPGDTRERPPSHLVWAILSTICCCWPLGIPAIVFAAQVNGKYEQGDIAGAYDASAKAKLFCWLAVGGSLLCGLGYLVLGLFGALAG